MIPRHAQRGAGALGVVALLLLVASVAILYLNRHLLLEHRGSANQWHAAMAFEAAEAGLSWMQDRLNHPSLLDAQCRPATIGSDSGTDFRARHLPSDTLPGPSAGCALPGGALACACPAASLAAADTARFAVRLAPEAGKGVVRAQALGCAADNAPCSWSAPDHPDADARAQLSVALRPVDLLPVLPAAALTCAGDCRLLEQARLRNERIAGQGLAAHTGGALDRAPGTQVLGLPGAPQADASAEHDSTLTAAAGTPCQAEALFEHLFRQSLAGYARSPLTWHLPCAADADCASAIRAAHAQGWRAFYLPAGTRLAGDEAIGSPEAPVALVTPGPLDVGGTPTLHGLLFARETGINASDGGAARVLGAVVACASHRQGGHSEVAHDADILARLREALRAYQRVPGSWRDAP